jgi:hypothetical protein
MQGIDRKVQQLTKVIYHLNAKGEEAGELGDTSASYENEIEGILRDAGERVKRFQAAAQQATDEKIIAEKVREVELKYEAQKQRALKDIEDFKRRAKEAQVRSPTAQAAQRGGGGVARVTRTWAVRAAPHAHRLALAQGAVKREADEKVAVMAKELDAAKREFALRLKQFAEVTDQLEKKGKDSEKGEKKRAATELADVVRKHNAKYNEMLQQVRRRHESARRACRRR